MRAYNPRPQKSESQCPTQTHIGFTSQLGLDETLSQKKKKLSTTIIKKKILF